MYVSVRLAVAAVLLSAIAAVLPLPVWASLALVNDVLLVAVIVDVARAPRAAQLQLSRTAPGVVELGQRRAVTLRLHNPLSRPLAVRLRDATLPSLRRDPRSHALTIPPGGWAEAGAEVVPSRRGRSPLGPVTVRTSGPLRLGGRQATVALHDVVKVYPALPGRAHVQSRLNRARMLQVGARSSSFRGGGTNFDSLREYHTDDEFRRINWRATARAGKPITNLYREERNQQVMLLFDASRTMAGTLEGVSRFEWSLDAGFAVGDLAARVGDHVGMISFGSRVFAMAGPAGGRSQPRRILDLLFDLEPELSAPDYQTAFATLLARYRRRSLMVLLTELAEPSAMDSLFAAVPVLLARHLVVVGSIVDPEIVALVTSVPAASEEVYLKAAAGEAVAARERSAARLQAMGVGVIDRPPGQLAGAMADRYLDIKAAGKL